MLDALSLDQLRVFVCVVEEGSFTAAARKVRRAQSVVSDLVATLERQIDVVLFDRSRRYPQLTPAGAVLLADARAILGTVDSLKTRARSMASGVEPELSAVIDVLFPFDALTGAALEFKARFPGTPLRLYVEALGGVVDAVAKGKANLGVVCPAPVVPPTMRAEKLVDVEMVAVAAPTHPLAMIPHGIPRSALAGELQLVLTDRSDLSAGREFGVYSSLTWRLADLFAKHAFLLNGLGWGSMPLHAVRADLAAGRLVELHLQDMPSRAWLSMSALFSAATPPGPAGRWLIERLKVHTADRPPRPPC